jgi:hypothetical protein
MSPPLEARQVGVLLLAAGAIAVVLASITSGVMARWRQRRLNRHAQQILINPPPEVDPAGGAVWWANLAGLLTRTWWRRLLCGTAHVGLEYRWAGRRLQISRGYQAPSRPGRSPPRSAPRGPAHPPPSRTPHRQSPPGRPTARQAGGALLPARPAGDNPLWCPPAHQRSWPGTGDPVRLPDAPVSGQLVPPTGKP